MATLIAASARFVALAAMGDVVFQIDTGFDFFAISPTIDTFNGALSVETLHPLCPRDIGGAFVATTATMVDIALQIDA